MIESLVNGRPFDEIFQFAKTLGLKKETAKSSLRYAMNKIRECIVI